MVAKLIYSIYVNATNNGVPPNLAITVAITSIVSSAIITATFIIAIVRFWDFLKGVLFDVACLIRDEDSAKAKGSDKTGLFLLNIANHSERIKFIFIERIELETVTGTKTIKEFYRAGEKEISDWRDFDKLESALQKGTIEKEDVLVENTIPYCLRLAPKSWACFFMGFWGVRFHRSHKVIVYYRIRKRLKTKRIFIKRR